MPAESGRFYEFGNFRLDAGAKTLFCLNAPVALTPKVFDTLQFLVEHAGRLLEKDELMQNIWHDRFVEESNLTFNIKMLRRALQDDAQAPRFIETVPRRGYRFIAEVKEGSPPVTAQVASELPVSVLVAEKRRKLYWAIAAGVVIVGSVLVLASWLRLGARTASARSIPLLLAPFKSEKLSNTGSAHALITPDGKYVAYINETGGKQSIWLRQLETSENIQIVPPSDGGYLGLAISHDGNSLYFARRDRADEVSSAVYRVMTFGGIPVKITEQAQGWISVSPDDRQISFVRCKYQPNDYCSLFVIDNDGRNERRILTRQKPARVTSNQFARDGRSIVFAAGQSVSGGRDFHLLRVDLASGAESEISPTAFFVINRLETLPNNEFLFSARETLDGKSRIWEVSATGEARALTNDAADYNDVSLSKAGDKLVSTQISNSFRLQIASIDEVKNPKVLIAARSVTFAPDGRIVYSGDDGDIWSINRDGGEQRQLTNNAFNDFSPRVSPDGRYVFFASNRTGSNQVWRMNADGSDQVQITHGEGGYPQLVTPDGKYVYFQSSLYQTLWQVPIAGGEEGLLLDRSVYSPAFSSDGKLVAYFFKDSDGRRWIAVVSVESRQTLHTFALNGENVEALKIVWANDSKSLSYIIANGGQKSLWEQTIDDAKPRLIASLGTDDIDDLALSPDGHSLAFIRGRWIHDAVLIGGLK